MERRKIQNDPLTHLRRRAEDRLKMPPPPALHSFKNADKDRLLQEMRIQQEELLLQNEDLKKLRDEAEILAAQYRDIYEFAPIGYVTLNSDGHVIRANLAAADLTGISRKALIGSLFATKLAQESVAGFICFLKSIFRDEKAQTVEAVIGVPGGKTRIVQIHARTSPDYAECLMTLMDITERRVAEENLRLGEARYRELVEDAASAIIRWRRDGTITFFNEYAQHFFGYAADDIIGKKVSILLPDCTSNGIDYSQLAENIVLKPDCYACNINENIRRDGSRVWMNWTNRPIYDASGQVAEILAIGSDITRMKQTEDLLMQNQEKLEEACGELDSFSYSVSHDLQAPLRAIDGYTRMILKHHGEDFNEDARREFEGIRSGVKLMGKLISDLLAFSRLSKKSLSITCVEIASLVKEAWDEVTAAHPGRSIIIRIGDLPAVYADRALLKQAILNLLSNAVKFSAAKSDVAVEVGADTSGDETVYFVKDSGVGFDMAYRDKLFNIFSTLHDRSEYEGTGVGLAIVHRIITRHGGRIWAEGLPGEGATFYFTLPTEDVSCVEKAPPLN